MTSNANANAKVRAAHDADADAITRIYAHYVLDSTATFEIEPPDAAEMSRRRADVQQQNLPYLVAEFNSAVVGYAYATPYRPRKAYRFTVEDSIYLHPEHTGKGLGKMLLAALIEECAQSGAQQMIAVIGGSDNAASIRLHESFGFHHVGILQSVGFKFDRWLDTTLMQKALTTS
jgi:phosphinothricin acetyltransferase